ncbi:MAG: lysophospholipid acyltransferase family protein [Myxococcaceae bacterium]
MFYRFVRAVIGFALRRFYRLQLHGLPQRLDGPIIFVGNHPNSLIDPALVFVITERPVTFLAKAPLFKVPVMGWLLRGLDALPVFRKQDAPSEMGKNEGTFEAASKALEQGRAITLFPEGKSHSEPQIAEIKTGCARIAFRAAQAGAKVRIVPVGLTYAEKHRFRSQVLIDVGQPIEVAHLLPGSAAEEPEAVRLLTERIARGLRAVTLNLTGWEDLPIIQTAEALYSFRLSERARDPERLRRFARGVEIFRAEQPERFEELRSEVIAFQHRLNLVHADPNDLTLQYRRTEVYPFVLRNLAALGLGFPLFALGCVLFGLPFMLTRVVGRKVKVAPDRVATLKFVSTLILAPVWLALLTGLSGWFWGTGWGLGVFFGALPLAIFTRYFLERRRANLRDAVTFLVLGNRAKLKARLLAEGETLAAEIETVAAELRPRVIEPASA